MSMKRAGILVGGMIILLAIVLLVIGNMVEKRNVEKITNQNQTTEVVTEVLSTEQTTEQTTEVVVEVTTESTTEYVEKETTKISEIDESSLKDLKVINKEEIAVISSKKLILLDTGVDSDIDKMLVYCFDLLTPGNLELNLYVTKTTYDSFNVGDKLTVNYDLYENNNGLNFPVINSATKYE